VLPITYLEDARKSLDLLKENPFPEEKWPNPAANWMIGLLYATLLDITAYLEEKEKLAQNMRKR